MSAGEKMKQGDGARDCCSRNGQGRFPCLAWPTWNQPGDAVRERCFQQREQPVQRPQQIPCDSCLSPVLHHLLHQTFHFFHLPLSWLLPSSCAHGDLCKASPHYSSSVQLSPVCPGNLLPPLALQLRSPLVGSFPWWFLSLLVSLWDSSRPNTLLYTIPVPIQPIHLSVAVVPFFPGQEPESGLPFFLALSRAVH